MRAVETIDFMTAATGRICRTISSVAFPTLLSMK
ncbi:hypothetical protein MF573_20355 [Klebsiella pneumoniae]|nr:hypothetical protein MF573_20355 [Klebsiella pneumoniae]